LGRRRRRVIRTVKKTLPKFFTCPSCGMPSIRISSGATSTTVTCGNCGIKHEFNIATKKESIDIYNEFVDKFMLGKV